MQRISAQFADLILHLEVTWVYKPQAAMYLATSLITHLEVAGSD